MSGDRWGPEGPPPEAYSRVTNPERFAPLHDIAADLLHRLELDFDVGRDERYGLDSELERRYQLARPSVSLVPRDIDAAPIIITFSTFPGLYTRFGRWYTAAFPICGCDACNETAETEIERLKSFIDDVTAGRFREAIRIPDAGAARTESEFWSANARVAGGWPLDRDRAQQLLAAGNRSSYDWAPWPKRK